MKGKINAFVWRLNRPKTVYLLMLTAFVIRAGFGIALGERALPMADQAVFDELARNIADGRGLMVTERLTIPSDDVIPEVRARWDRFEADPEKFPERVRDLRLNALWGVIQPGKPTAFIEPLVPIIFATIYKIFGPGLIAPRIFQSLLDALVVGMLFGIGNIALPKSRAPGIAALIYAFYPFSIMFTGALITQPIYLFLQCASVYLFFRFMREPGWGVAVLFGIAFGLTILTRISIITFAPFFIIALAVWDGEKPKWTPAISALILAGLLLIPWVVRNQTAMGEPLLLPTKGGRNLWEYNNQVFSRERLIEGEYQGTDELYFRFAKNNIDKIKGKQFIKFPEFTDETEIERDRILNNNVRQFIRLNPGIFVKLCFLRFYQFFRVTPTHHPHIFFKLAAWASFGWILPLSIFGGVILWKNWRRLGLIYLLILYNIGIHTLTASGIPHRLPIDPFLILLAAFSLHWIGAKFEEIFYAER
ncbi:MAG: glycosyltransferase family 39 protein [candidate division Zixibacteria bacterium]|nr:glycosyltransferase family 39 protein [Candidatus Tariuqbacter arcticus]